MPGRAGAVGGSRTRSCSHTKGELLQGTTAARAKSRGWIAGFEPANGFPYFLGNHHTIGPFTCGR